MEDYQQLKSFNWNTGIYTLLFFIFGLLYYLYKFNNYRNAINNNSIPFNHNQSTVYNNTANNTTNNNIPNQNQQNNVNTSDPNFLNIKVLVEGERENHLIHKDTILRNFVFTNLSNHFNSNNQAVYLIYQGTRLDLTKRLSYYPQIKNESIIHCFITVLRSYREGANTNSNHNNANQNSSNDAFYNNSVISLHTIVFHGCFFIVGIILILIFKKVPEIFSRNVLFILLIFFIIWLNQFSKIVAKYIIFRNIDWRF